MNTYHTGQNQGVFGWIQPTNQSNREQTWSVLPEH